MQLIRHVEQNIFGIFNKIETKYVNESIDLIKNQLFDLVLCFIYIYIFVKRNLLYLQDELDGLQVDAYIVVFSVHDSTSFDTAKQYLHCIRCEMFSDRAIILVANKVDLVRKRQISADGTYYIILWIQRAMKYNGEYE